MLKLRNKREAEHFLSVTKTEAKGKTNKSSNLALEDSTLESEKTTQIMSDSASKYNLTTVQNILKTKAHSNSELVSEGPEILNVSQREI